MPDLAEFIEISADTERRTVSLSGETSALLFSALASIAQLWQWNSPSGLFPADIAYIHEICAKANKELMVLHIGEIVPYITEDPPEYTLDCDGGLYLAEDYPELYDVIDPVYKVGLDGFVTPDLRSRSMIGVGTGSGLSTYAVNDMTGEENHSLSADENGTHGHTDLGHAHIYQPPGATGLAVSPGELPVLLPALLPTNTTTGNANITDSGLGSGHNTIHPVTAVKFAVRYA